MANCCFIDMTIKFSSKKTADSFIAAARADIAETKQSMSAPNFGGGMYVFDAEVAPCGDSGDVTLLGWVKWALDDVTFAAFCHSLKDVISVHSTQEECGNCVYGTLDWDAVTDALASAFIPYDKWPSPPDECYSDDAKMDDWNDSETERLARTLDAYGRERKYKLCKGGFKELQLYIDMILDNVVFESMEDEAWKLVQDNMDSVDKNYETSGKRQADWESIEAAVRSMLREKASDPGLAEF